MTKHTNTTVKFATNIAESKVANLAGVQDEGHTHTVNEGMYLCVT